MLLLPATGAADAAIVAETARAAIEALRIPHPDGATPLVTASFGVATFVPHGFAPETAGDPAVLVSAADAALYRAKSAGRNRVEFAEPGAARPTAPGRPGEPPAGMGSSGALP